MLTERIRTGVRALIHTVLAGHALALESLVLAGADSSIADRSGQTALDHARDLDREWLFLSQGILDKKPDRQQKKKSLAPKTTDNRRDQPEIDTSRLTERVFAKLNEFRTKHGKSNFISDPDLAGMAARHSASMAQSGRFETVDAQGNDILTRAAALGYGPADPSSGTLNLVENIYRIRLYSSAVTERKDGAAHTTFQWRSTEDLASQMVADWLKDDQQNRQILDEHFDRAGIGVAIGEQDRIFVTYNLARIEENAGEITLNSDDRPKLEPRALAERVHVLLNEARLEQGLVELLLDERLSTIAANHSQDMAEHGYFDHVNREDEGPTERAVRGGVKIHLDGENYTLKNEIGENLYRGRLFSGKKFELRDGARYATLLWLNFEELAQSVVQGLLQETSNRDNIFNQRFERQGIGIAIDRDDHLIFSQLFAMTEGLPDMQRYKVANPEKRPTIKIKQLTREIHRLVNQERAKRQLQPLSYDDDLAKIALKHSRDMAKNNYFAHKNAKGERAVDRARRGHYRTSQIMQGNVLRSGIGENLFRDRIYTGFRIIKNRSIEFRWNSLEELAQKVVDGWMSSQGHRGNMLNAFYQREGIGVVLDKNEQIYVTQNFF